MNFHNFHIERARAAHAFTLVEAVVAISLIGIGVASTIGALTKINSIASMSRNATGAETAAQNQIDLLLSDSPFNPQKNNPPDPITGVISPQIPPELTVGTHTYTNVPIYKEPTTGVIVSGTMTTVVADVSPTYNGFTIPTYRATVTVIYTYLSRTYTTTMSTVRVCDI